MLFTKTVIEMAKTTKKTKTLRFWGVSPKFDIDIETCVSEGNKKTKQQER